jgi:hypothetical protein
MGINETGHEDDLAQIERLFSGRNVAITPSAQPLNPAIVRDHGPVFDGIVSHRQQASSSKDHGTTKRLKGICFSRFSKDLDQARS